MLLSRFGFQKAGVDKEWLTNQLRLQSILRISNYFWQSLLYYFSRVLIGNSWGFIIKCIFRFYCRFTDKRVL